jgi:hypothetical protein
MSQRSIYCAALLSDVYSSMMTSLTVTSQSKERPFVLLHREAIYNQSAARSPVQHVRRTEFSPPSERISRKDLILPELLSNDLSDVPKDIFSGRESESDDSVREKKLCSQNKVTVKVKQAPEKVTILQMQGQPCE